MRIVVFGAGAMGGALGARLIEAGHDVMLVDIDRARVSAINRDGVRLEEDGSERVVKVPATAEIAEVGEAELAIVFVKSQFSGDVARAAKPLAEAGTVFLTLQNGLGNAEAIAAEVGAAQVLAGVTYDSAILDDDGLVRLTNKGATYVGELEGLASERVDGVIAAFRDAGMDAHPTDDAAGLLWGKALVNCVFNATCAITGFRSGEIGEFPLALEWAERVAAETASVAAANGITLPYEDAVERVRTVAKNAGASKPSMLQDVEKGRITEVEHINGAVARAGRRVGVPTPYNDALTTLVGMIDAKNAAARSRP
ncbi:MAG: 2-dehydropantoate 2-reductase [Pseudolysinimonas sp.]|uniref:ketopantoate reductase family protein n=1 Tax=Pseudolysinimonas sp. TaxID=2680009 RepID=UPI003C741F56